MTTTLVKQRLHISGTRTEELLALLSPGSTPPIRHLMGHDSTFVFGPCLIECLSPDVIIGRGKTTSSAAVGLTEARLVPAVLPLLTTANGAEQVG